MGQEAQSISGDFPHDPRPGAPPVGLRLDLLFYPSVAVAIICFCHSSSHADFDRRLLVVAGELESVGEQVHKDLLE